MRLPPAISAIFAASAIIVGSAAYAGPEQTFLTCRDAVQGHDFRTVALVCHAAAEQVLGMRNDDLHKVAAAGLLAASCGGYQELHHTDQALRECRAGIRLAESAGPSDQRTKTINMLKQAEHFGDKNMPATKPPALASLRLDDPINCRGQSTQVSVTPGSVGSGGASDLTIRTDATIAEHLNLKPRIGDHIVMQHIGSAVGFGMFAVCNGTTLGIAEELIKPDQTKWTFDHYIVRPFNWNEKTSQWEEWHKPKDCDCGPGEYLVTEKIPTWPHCEPSRACQTRQDAWIRGVRMKVMIETNGE